MSRGPSVLATLLGAAVIAAACAPAAPTASAAPSGAQTTAPKIPGGTVTIRTAGDWGNPIDGGQTSTGGNGLMLASVMYDRLAYMDVSTGKIVPYVAASWTQTPTSVTFKLRDDVTCADGTKVTPTVVYNSFARYIAPSTKSIWVAPALGPEPYTLAKDDAAGTFTVSIGKPFANLLYGLTNNSTGIICPKGLEPGADFTKASYGSGPFVFKSAVQGSEYVVTKREGWSWGPQGGTSSESGFPDTIVFKVIANDTTAANLLLTGGLDIASIAGPDVRRLASDATLERKVSAAGAPYILAFNHAPERLTSSETVRKAIATALDAKAWTTAAGQPDAPVSTNIQATPGGYCYVDLSALIPKPSVANARRILTDAGYTAGSDGKLQKDGKPLKLLVVGSNFTGSGIEYMGDTLQQVGITVDLVNTDLNNFSATYYAKANYDVLIGLHGGDVGTAARTAAFMVGKAPDQGGNNRLRTSDPKLEALVDKAYGASTEAEACQAWKDFNTYVLERSIAIPWAAGVSHWFSRKGEFSYIPNNLQPIPATVRRTK